MSILKEVIESLREANQALKDYARTAESVADVLSRVLSRHVSTGFVDYIKIKEATHCARHYYQAGPWAEMLNTDNKINWI